MKKAVNRELCAVLVLALFIVLVMCGRALASKGGDNSSDDQAKANILMHALFGREAPRNSNSP